MTKTPKDKKNPDTPKDKKNLAPKDKKNPNVKDDSKKDGDKIFQNDYNTGNVEHEAFPDLKIDPDYSQS